MNFYNQSKIWVIITVGSHFNRHSQLAYVVIESGIWILDPLMCGVGPSQGFTCTTWSKISSMRSLQYHNIASLLIFTFLPYRPVPCSSAWTGFKDQTFLECDCWWFMHT